MFKDAEVFQGKKGGSFPPIGLGTSRYSRGKKKTKLKLNSYLTLYTKISYKWFIDLNPAKEPLALVVFVEAVDAGLQPY